MARILGKKPEEFFGKHYNRVIDGNISTIKVIKKRESDNWIECLDILSVDNIVCEYCANESAFINSYDIEEFDIEKNPEKIIIRGDHFFQGFFPCDFLNLRDLYYYNIVRKVRKDFSLKELCENDYLKFGDLDYVFLNVHLYSARFFGGVFQYPYFSCPIKDQRLPNTNRVYLYYNNYNSMIKDIRECKHILGSNQPGFEKIEKYCNLSLPEFLSVINIKN
jgi:hypothetical protein